MSERDLATDRAHDSQNTAPYAGDATPIQNVDELEHSQQLSRQSEQIPSSVPGFAISHCLGKGAYGSVWLAREERTGKQVAIKFYTHRRGLDRFVLNREVEKLAVLYTSRNIVRLLDVDWDNDPPYFVMEYLRNGSLATLLESGTLPTHEAVRIAKSVLQALVHAHGSGILHCDLKPANVLLDAHFEPRLCDFGQSRLSDEQNPALGTFFYMAPEQADLEAVPDARWDVYALGALLYHMLSGQAPYRTTENDERLQSAETLQERLKVYRDILRESPKPVLTRKRHGVDRRLADIVDRCLQIDPRKRFPNAQAVLDTLEVRDRLRSRRPLVALGIVGPGLLLLAMATFFNNAMHTAVERARSDLTARALESDAFFADNLALGLQRGLENRLWELQQIAENRTFRKTVVSLEGKTWLERRNLLTNHINTKKRVDDHRDALNRPKDASWFLVDRDGYQRWRHEYDEKTMDKRYNYRDYFHGKGYDLDPNEEGFESQEIEINDQPNISVAFVSTATYRYMVAISVPVRDLENKNVIARLARTIELGDLLDDSQHLGRGQANGDDDVNRTVALVQDSNWKLLDHPWIGNQELSAGVFDKLQLEERIIQKLERFQKQSQSNGIPSRTERDDNYSDPVGSADVDPDQSYGGKWLAAFAPIGNTGWTVIVQERKADALKPVEDMDAELNRYAISALAVSCALIGLLWYFVWRALSDRGPVLTTRKGGTSTFTGSTTPLSES